MSPENQWLEDVFPIEIVPFRGHVSLRGCILFSNEESFAEDFLNHRTKLYLMVSDCNRHIYIYIYICRYI